MVCTKGELESEIIVGDGKVVIPQKIMRILKEETLISHDSMKSFLKKTVDSGSSTPSGEEGFNWFLQAFDQTKFFWVLLHEKTGKVMKVRVDTRVTAEC